MAYVDYNQPDTSISSSQYLTPKSTRVIDVVGKMKWTLTPPSGRINVPSISFKEYQINAGQLIASLLYIYRLGLNVNAAVGTLDAETLYKNKYLATLTGFSYIFPYFNPKKFSRQTTFGSDEVTAAFKNIRELGNTFIKGFGKNGIAANISTRSSIIGTFMNSVQEIGGAALPGGFNLDLPQQWQKTSEGGYDFSFDLFNTGTVDDISDNRNLCYILAYQNTQSRRNAMITDPVCIYDIECPDVVTMPAAYITDLEITNLGNTQIMQVGGVNRIIPEAYRIKISFKSLLQPSRQLMAGMDTGKIVSAIGQDSAVTDFTNSFNNAVNSAFNKANNGGVTPTPGQNIGEAG